MIKLLPIALAATTALLTACGGGGGDDSGTPAGGTGGGGTGGGGTTTTTFNASAAWHNLLITSTGQTQANLSGTGSDGNTYNAVFATLPGSGTFAVTNESLPTTAVLLGYAQTPGGVIAPSVVYYRDSNDSVRGARTQASGSSPATCYTAAAGASLPTSNAVVGSGGVLFTLTPRTACTLNAAVAAGAVQEVRWSIVADSGNTSLGYFCVSGLLNAPGITACAQINTAGTLQGPARITVSNGGFTLTATN